MIVERKRIGIARIARKGGKKKKMPEPKQPEKGLTYEDVLRRHERIRKILDEHGKKGECLRLTDIAKAVRLPEDVVENHIKILQGDKYVASPTDNVQCSYAALEKLRERMRRM